MIKRISQLLQHLLFLLIISSELFAKDVDIGNKVPNLDIRLLDGTKTKIHDLADDGPLLIDFWATWCTPCKKLMKFLNEYHLEFEDENFKVLMINTDSPRSIGKVKSYVRSQGYEFFIGMDPNKIISKKLNGLVMPTLILVDKYGEIVWRHQGYIVGEELEVKKQIQLLINKIKEKKVEG